MGTNREGEEGGGEAHSSPVINPMSESDQPIILKSTPKPTPTTAGRSCKGCLYYSSILKSKSKNPTCVGLSKSIEQVPSYIVGETELEASKEGRDLVDFKYSCIGYSVYLDSKSSSADPQKKVAKLPFCVGLEVLLDRTPSTNDTNAPAYVKKNEDGSVPQMQRRTPSQSMGDEFLNRFKRNAGLVASGVIRNMNKIGKHIKDSVDDILYPYRRPPK